MKRTPVTKGMAAIFCLILFVFSFVLVSTNLHATNDRYEQTQIPTMALTAANTSTVDDRTKTPTATATATVTTTATATDTPTATPTATMTATAASTPRPTAT